MRKLFVLSLTLLLSFSACMKKKKKPEEEPMRVNRSEMVSEVDIPVADQAVNSVFDATADELVKADELVYDDLADQNLDLADASYIDDGKPTLAETQTAVDDFAWIQEPQEEEFKKVYFDFDRFAIRADQEDAVNYNVGHVKDVLSSIPQDKKCTIVVEGHADHAAGSDVYNLALSEKRAKVVKDRMVSQGVPGDAIKIVGRGSEIPALIDGKPVEGDRNQQWPNRRDEIRVLYS